MEWHLRRTLQFTEELMLYGLRHLKVLGKCKLLNLFVVTRCLTHGRVSCHGRPHLHLDIPRTQGDRGHFAGQSSLLSPGSYQTFAYSRPLTYEPRICGHPVV